MNEVIVVIPSYESAEFLAFELKNHAKHLDNRVDADDLLNLAGLIERQMEEQ